MRSLRIEGFIGPHLHAYVRAIFVCAKPEITGPIILLVDSGATVTTLLEGDAERFGINFRKLKKSKIPVQVGGGIMYPYMLEDVALIFRTTNEKPHVERLRAIDVIKPTRTGTRPEFSLLGVDVLSRFKMTYNKDYIILEK